MFLRVLFGLIGSTAFVSNLLVVAVILKNKSMLKTPYNVLVLSLAVTDMITGIGVLITPNCVIGADSIAVPSGALGQLFCRAIVSAYLIFTLGIVSVYTVTCMAIDRWFAVARPTKYKSAFTKTRVKFIVVFIWVWSVLLNAPHLFEMKAITTNGATACVWVVLTEGTTRKAVGVLEFCGKFFLPVLATFLTLLSLRSHVRASPALFRTNRGRAGLYLLRMCMFTALALALCWLPNQMYYLLFKYDVTQLGNAAHHFTVAFCMFNSSLNPWVCFASNKVYRRHLFKLVCPGVSNRLVPSNTSTLDVGSTQSQQPTSHIPHALDGETRSRHKAVEQDLHLVPVV